MTDFNLPPGCRVSDIPGNRPEDEANEVFWDILIGKMKENHKGLSTPEEAWYENDELIKLVEITRTLAFAEGFEQGRAEGQIEASTMMEAMSKENEEKSMKQTEPQHYENSLYADHPDMSPGEKITALVESGLADSTGDAAMQLIDQGEIVEA